MSELAFSLTVKRTHAPLSGDDVILRKELNTGIRMVEAVAGHARFQADGQEARLGVLATPQTAVRIPEFSVYAHQMFMVYSVNDAYEHRGQAWVGLGNSDRVRKLDCSYTARFLTALEEHHGDHANKALDLKDTQYGRFDLLSPDINQNNILGVARLAVARFAGLVTP